MNLEVHDMNKYSKCIFITAVISFCASAWSHHTLTLLEPAGSEVWVTGAYGAMGVDW